MFCWKKSQQSHYGTQQWTGSCSSSRWWCGSCSRRCSFYWSLEQSSSSSVPLFSYGNESKLAPNACIFFFFFFKGIGDKRAEQEEKKFFRKNAFTQLATWSLIDSEDFPFYFCIWFICNQESIDPCFVSGTTWEMSPGRREKQVPIQYSTPTVKWLMVPSRLNNLSGNFYIKCDNMCSYVLLRNAFIS